MNNNKMLMLNMMVLALSTIDAVHGAVASSTGTDTEFSKAWNFDTKKWSFDPTAWDSDLKARMYMVATGAFYAAYTGMTTAMVVGFAVFLFGLVKLNWPLVATSCLALHGWRHNHKVLLAVGVCATYALSFGFTFK